VTTSSTRFHFLGALHADLGPGCGRKTSPEQNGPKYNLKNRDHRSFASSAIPIVRERSASIQLCFAFTAGLLLRTASDMTTPVFECFERHSTHCPRACWDIAEYGRCNSRLGSDAGCLCNEPVFAESVASCIESTCSRNDAAAADYEQLADEK